MFRALVFLSLVFSLSAQESKDPAAGHSYHGGAFNEGPRQAARLLGGTGIVEFDVTTKSETSRQFFLQGLGQLHGFWYFEAERSFRQAALTDDEFAMSYWGMAVANIENEKRARDFLSKAYEFSENITDREKMYLDSFAARVGLPTDAKELAKFRTDKLKFKPKKDKKSRCGAYVKGLEKIILKYPKDIEAKALLVMNLWANARQGHPINSHVAVDSLANEVLAKQPLHPVHHYRIHLWDKKKADQALNSAALGGEGSPSIAHMWHMPGHIYSRLHRFADAAWQQEASARTDHRHMMRDLVLPDQIHNFAHNNEWLIRNLINLGDVDRAYSLARNMSELPRHPKYNSLKKGSSNYGRQRLFQLLNTFELWETAISLKDTPYLEVTDKRKEQVKRLRLLGRAYYSLNKTKEGDAISEELKELQKKIITEAIAAHEKKEKEKEEKRQKKIAEAKKESEKSKDAKPEKAKEEVAEVKEKDAKPKKEEKRKDTKLEEETADALKEMAIVKLLSTKGATEKLKSFKDLSGIDKWLQTQVHLALKENDKALKLSEKAYKDNKNEVVFMARHILTLNTLAKKDEAKKVFAELRKVSEYTKLSVKPFKDLAIVAKAFSYPEDWRLPMKKSTDLGRRPKVNSLGPFRWKPVKADSWVLPNSYGDLVDFSKLNRGQAYIVMFYLGADCLHCVEQLNAFAPKKKEFEDAGVKLLAVSLEGKMDLMKSVSKYSDDGKFPFPIVSDKALTVFKKYRCYDDFEKTALHGTFLIDGDGDIRWLDISYDPFTDTKFLLEESKRLLSQPKSLRYSKK
ncbi:MAG: redoxin domain-containing protein [Lentisphaeraceae bacterium]|nr:redoxin domain-containing protein [Lentisphaeraceae bacterium]